MIIIIMVIMTNVMLKAHDVLGTGDEEAKKLAGNLLGLLLTLPKQVLITIIIRDASVVTPSIKKPKIMWEFFPPGHTAQAGHHHHHHHMKMILMMIMMMSMLTLMKMTTKATMTMMIIAGSKPNEW